MLSIFFPAGPLYLIVEYCELGSLKSFLRASQFRNKGSWDDKKRRAEDEVLEDGEGRVITIRDLFAFAWQIAKGMDYLAGLKVEKEYRAVFASGANGVQIKPHV